MAKMKINNKAIIIWLILGLIILLPLVYNVAISEGQSPEPFLEKPKGEKCILKETKFHMILLKKTRDEVVREGKRGQIGFRDCMRCHTNRERFCDRCHNKVNLKPDCFNCHYYK